MLWLLPAENRCQCTQVISHHDDVFKIMVLTFLLTTTVSIFTKTTPNNPVFAIYQTYTKVKDYFKTLKT